MSAALCLFCGNIKHGAFMDCDACGAPVLDDDHELNLAFTDHHLDISTLEDFGRVIKHLNAIAPDYEAALMSFLRLITERHPEIVYNLTTQNLEEKAGAVLHLGSVPEIRIKDGRLANREPENGAERISICRVQHRELTCEECGHTQSFAAWQRINPNRSVVGYALLLAEAVFKFSCRQCGNTRPVSYESYYFDYNKGLMVWLKPEHEDIELPKCAPVEESLVSELKIKWRTVRHPHEVSEKVRIIEDGWDDVTIELQKISVCVEYGIDLAIPPIYVKTTHDENEGVVVEFDAGHPLKFPADEVRATIEPVVEELKRKGELSEVGWQSVTASSMMSRLIAAGLLKPIKPPKA